jgi:hypothetical protein
MSVVGNGEKKQAVTSVFVYTRRKSEICGMITVKMRKTPSKFAPAVYTVCHNCNRSVVT